MGIKSWLTNRRLKRLEGDLQMLEDRRKNKIKFNPRYALGIIDTETEENYTKRLEEYRVWFTGSSKLLRDLYNNKKADGNLNYFWRKAPNNYRMIHSGIPGLISTKMATILFGSGINIKIEVFDDAGKPDDKLTAQAQELSDNLVGIVDLYEKVENATQNASWAGHVYFKLSHKVKLLDYPILESVDATKAEAIKERGITKAIVFKYWYQHNKNEYRLDEIYTTVQDENSPYFGDAVIYNRLYKLKPDGKEEEVDLAEIPDTENDLPEFIYKGLRGMIAFDLPNKTPSHEFIDSDYGASDYEGALDSFDALDEAYSELIRELRSNKTIRYIPSNMVPKVTYQNKDGSYYQVSMLPDEFIDNYVQTEGDQDQNTKNEINITEIADKTEQHLIKWRTALSMAINKAEVSPFALGITGLESINASAESQQERNKTTLEMRERKHRIWKAALEKMWMKVLEMNSWMQKNTTAKQDGFAKVDLNFANTNVVVSFNPYLIPNQKDKIDTWVAARSASLSSIYNGVKEIHPDWSETQIMDEVNLIRFEQGMSFDNPNNLPELTGISEIENENEESQQVNPDENIDKKVEGAGGGNEQ